LVLFIVRKSIPKRYTVQVDIGCLYLSILANGLPYLGFYPRVVTIITGRLIGAGQVDRDQAVFAIEIHIINAQI
jgi:hypothetical protein